MPLSIKIYLWDALKLQEHLWVNKNLDWLLKLLLPWVCASHPSTAGRLSKNSLALFVSGTALSNQIFVKRVNKARTNDLRKQPQGLTFAERFSKLPESKASRPEPASRTMTWKAPYEPICGCLWGLGCSTNKGAMADTCRYHKPSQTTSQLHRWLKTLPELHSCQPQHLDWRGLALQRHVAATQSLVYG